MSDPRFLMFIPDEKSKWLRSEFPNCFLLLSLIAERARRESDLPDGLIPGDAILGDYKSAGISRQNYRTALKNLVDFGIIKIVYNGKCFFEVRKLTIKLTIKSTIVNLIDSSIWDINSRECNQQTNQPLTNCQPTANHKQQRTTMNYKETTTTPTPSKENVAVVFYECLKNENLSLADQKTCMLTIKKNGLTEEDIIYGIHFADSLEGNYKTNRISTILWASKEKPEIKNKTKKTQQQQEAYKYLEWMKEKGYENKPLWCNFYNQNLKNIEFNFIYLNFDKNSSISLTNDINTVISDIRLMKNTLEMQAQDSKHG